MARIDDYKESFRLASIELRKRDPAAMAETAGVEVSGSDSSSSLRVPFLGGGYVVEIGPETDVRREDGVEVPLPDKILIAHYLLGAAGGRTGGELITFRQIPDGKFYFDAFQRRARDPFVSFFGTNGPLFRKCAELMGAKPVEGGDVAMQFDVFPHIFLRLILWEGDDEFPPEATILFDESIQRQLPVEDVAFMSGTVVYRLIGLARKMQAGV